MNPAGTSSGTASATSRSGGSYRRVNPQINQVSGAREESVRETGKATEYSRVNRTTNQATGSEPYTEKELMGRYHVLSNLPVKTRSTAGLQCLKNTTTTTTNPGNSRSFYRRTTFFHNRQPTEQFRIRCKSNSGTSRSSTYYQKQYYHRKQVFLLQKQYVFRQCCCLGTRSSVSSGSRFVFGSTG